MTREHDDLLLRSNFSQIQRHEVSQRLEAEKTPQTNILDNIISFPGAEYGCETPEALLDNFVSRIVRRPHDVHILFAGGESGNGKSRTLEEMMARVLFLDKKNGRSKTRLKQFADDHGLEIRLHSFPWGDASEHLPDDWMIDKEADYHDNPELHAGKQREVAQAEEVMGTAIAETIRDCNEEQKSGGKYIDIFIGDVPINTGDIIDGKRVGILRAYQMMKDLRHRKGRYQGLNYQLSFFMQSASTEVREEAFADRSIITDGTLTEEERRETLAKKGKKFPDSRASVKEAAQEPASPDQMIKLQQDGNDVLIALFSHADPKIRPGHRYEDEITQEALNHRSTQLRVPMIGRVQHPHILHDVLNYPPNSRRTANFYNGKVVDVEKVVENLMLRRPIVERRDSIIQRMKAQEERSSDTRDFYSPPPPDQYRLRGDFY